ncbi:MAG TPA: ubiquitin-like domain-containing protein [Clostridia bacterium]|nr:ubiquitin-like domain-containing protein [Clostridia bacterium]
MESHLSRNKFFDKKILIAAVAVVLLLVGAMFVKPRKTVVIKHDGQEIQVSTLANTVEDVLREQNITVGDDDKIIPKMNEQIEDGMEIAVHRAFQIRLVDGQIEKSVSTTESNVKDLINSLNIKLGEGDKIDPKLEEPIGKGRVVKITRVSREVAVETQELPFQTIFKNNNSLEKGKTKKIQKGEKGLKEIRFEVLYEDGIEVEREIIEENIVKDAVNEIIEKGTLALVATSSRGDISRYSKVLTMTATAYDLSFQSTGRKPGDKYYGVTASGTKIRPGVAAVDPKVIPLGTKLYIESTDKTQDYGYATAEDKGSAIKGNKIDLFIENAQDVKKFGRRTVKVYILE